MAGEGRSLLASHDGARMAAGTGPSKVLCIMLSEQFLTIWLHCPYVDLHGR